MTQPASMGGDTAADEDRSGTGETVAPKARRLGRAKGPLSREELVLVDRWWRAANYLAVGQIYLMANPLLREPLLRRAREAPAARALRHGARPEPRARPR